MRIAYVNYGNQSGVTPNVIRGLQDFGHRVVFKNGWRPSEQPGLAWWWRPLGAPG